MSNFERILQSLSVESFANLLISSTYEDNGDYHFDGEDEVYIEHWVEQYTTMANDDCYTSRQECYEDTLTWLKEEVDNNQIGKLLNGIGQQVW